MFPLFIRTQIFLIQMLKEIDNSISLIQRRVKTDKSEQSLTPQHTHILVRFLYHCLGSVDSLEK